MVRTSQFAIVPWDNNRVEAVDINPKQSLDGLMDAAKTPAPWASGNNIRQSSSLHSSNISCAMRLCGEFQFLLPVFESEGSLLTVFPSGGSTELKHE